MLGVRKWFGVLSLIMVELRRFRVALRKSSQVPGSARVYLKTRESLGKESRIGQIRLVSGCVCASPCVAC